MIVALFLALSVTTGEFYELDAEDCNGGQSFKIRFPVGPISLAGKDNRPSDSKSSCLVYGSSWPHKHRKAIRFDLENYANFGIWQCQDENCNRCVTAVGFDWNTCDSEMNTYFGGRNAAPNANTAGEWGMVDGIWNYLDNTYDLGNIDAMMKLMGALGAWSYKVKDSLTIVPSVSTGSTSVAIPARSYDANCHDVKYLWDGDDSTSCSTDAVHTDAVLINFETPLTASGFTVTMSGYTGTLWVRARSSNGAAANDYSSYLKCIGGEFWDNPTRNGADVEIQVTSVKNTYDIDLGESQDIDCIGLAMSPYHGNPRGVYDPQPRFYGLNFGGDSTETETCSWVPSDPQGYPVTADGSAIRRIALNSGIYNTEESCQDVANMFDKSFAYNHWSKAWCWIYGPTTLEEYWSSNKFVMVTVHALGKHADFGDTMFQGTIDHWVEKPADGIIASRTCARNNGQCVWSDAPILGEPRGPNNEQVYWFAISRAIQGINGASIDDADHCQTICGKIDNVIAMVLSGWCWCYMNSNKREDFGVAVVHSYWEGSPVAPSRWVKTPHDSSAEKHCSSETGEGDSWTGTHDCGGNNIVMYQKRSCGNARNCHEGESKTLAECQEICEELANCAGFSYWNNGDQVSCIPKSASCTPKEGACNTETDHCFFKKPEEAEESAEDAVAVLEKHRLREANKALLKALETLSKA